MAQMARQLYVNERGLVTDNPLDTYIPESSDLPSVAYISRIDAGLYMGGVNPTLFLPPQIDYVVSLHPVEYRSAHELDGFAAFKAEDSKQQDLSIFDMVARVTAEFWSRGPTLVHCAWGLNRSAIVTALTMMHVKGFSADTVIQSIRDKRSPMCLYNQNFEKYVREHE